MLRLGGSIAWPVKPGRVVEKTEFHLLDRDNRHRAYLGGQLARAFPPAVAETSATLNVGTPEGVSVESCLARIRAGDGWHNNTLAMVGHWLARGWSDAEIPTRGREPDAARLDRRPDQA